MTTNHEFKNEIIDRLTIERKKYAEQVKRYTKDLVQCDHDKESSAEHKAKTAAKIMDMMYYNLSKMDKIDNIIRDVKSL